MAGARSQAGGVGGLRLHTSAPVPSGEFSVSLCRTGKLLTYRRKFQTGLAVGSILHDLSPNPSTRGRCGPLATSADRSELDQAEGHGGAENRGDPGLKADRPGSLIERTGGFDLIGRETGSRPKGPFEGFGRTRPEGTGSGSMDGAGLDLVEHRRPGARQDTADHHRGSPR